MTSRQISLLRKCRLAMHRSLASNLAGNGAYNTRESLLSYFDHAKFYAMSVEAPTYSNVTSAINILCSKPETGLIKLHKGTGSLAHYTFKKEIIEKMVDDIEAN